LLADSARAVWYDRDDIQAGDLWRDEIGRGIGAADELVLLLSDESLSSEFVAAEVRLALAGQKLVRPIAVAPLSQALPEHLRDIHYLDISGIADPDKLRILLGGYFGDAGADMPPDMAMRLRACRSIWPRFSADLVSERGRVRARDDAARFDRLAARYAEASTIWLNAGLVKCIAGDWEEGVTLLRSHARAANSFPGWYLLAIHLLRRDPVRSVSLACVREALEAISNALAIAPHPLAILAAAILETGGDNRGDRNCDQRIMSFLAAEFDTREAPAEYLRLFWCLKSSFSVLGRHEAPLQARIREIAS
jgi:hypothetical protein